MTAITIYNARKIITMNPRQPTAQSVAVREGHILGAGDLEKLSGWGEYTLDERFADLVIMPGLVEGHCHSWEGSAWEDTYVGFFDRQAPDRSLHLGAKSIDAVIERLQAAEKSLTDSDQPLLAWGLDPIYFDDRRVVAADLDRVSVTRPIVIMHASGHIVNVNSALLRQANINASTDAQGIIKDAQGNPTGELQGPALRVVAYNAVGHDRFLDMGRGESLWRFARSAQLAGVTTATDLANELPRETVDHMADVTQRDDFPLRIVPAFIANTRPTDEGVAWVKEIKQKNNPKLRLGLIKLVADGSIQGFTARLKWPGYYNGAANGLWYVDPDQMPKLLAAYHAAGLQVHIHTNGDQATEVTIGAIEQVLRDHPNPDARFTLQHCQMAHDAHFRRMAKLGICANLFANHLYYWGDQHYEITMGPERAQRLEATATAKRLGVPFGIHSDAPVTHLAPLFTAWCAVNRQTYSGRILGAAERLSVDDALYAITLGAAYTLKMDHEIGSIETGKRADFTILEQDPQAVDPTALKDIPVWGTVVGGQVFANSAIGTG